MQFKCEQQITKTAEVDLPKSIDRIHQQFFLFCFLFQSASSTF